MRAMKKIVILISGRGSNMDAILRAARDEKWPAQVAAVISNRADAPGLAVAQAHGIPAIVVASVSYPEREAFDAELQRTIDSFSPDLVVLAGFMRILTAGFVAHYAGRMLNVHPSLLPSFTGLATHRRALETGVKIHGATVHFVTAELDHGPIVAQAAVSVLPDDDEQTLSARVLEQEHIIYPHAIRCFVEGRLSVRDGIVRIADAR
ncbi:phosphoribosylglycinamide formyltransferase [Oxalicibacterium solurbis]|uniref:Phosphoribosylglycinamide formyltransferase n=2 Tax=Oxalicibacterium solurbis TaxID=69280 RepID=A0A8J3AUH9_9BURK|nr:phosphoribosylglycinamide formyltransferase [Oxalicibacterium solurbis]